MNILALDLGNRTGWAAGDHRGRVLASGSLNLARRGTTHAQRFIRLREFIACARIRYYVRQLVYEEVNFQQYSTQAAKLYGGYRGVVLGCEGSGLTVRGVTVQDIKREATGKGAARKEIMMRTAALAWPYVDIEDDNHADALWLLAYAAREARGEDLPARVLCKRALRETVPGCQCGMCARRRENGL